MVICYTTGCLRDDGKRLEHENTSFLMFSGDIKNFLAKVKQRGFANRDRRSRFVMLCETLARKFEMSPENIRKLVFKCSKRYSISSKAAP